MDFGIALSIVRPLFHENIIILGRVRVVLGGTTHLVVDIRQTGIQRTGDLVALGWG